MGRNIKEFFGEVGNISYFGLSGGYIGIRIYKYLSSYLLRRVYFIYVVYMLYFSYVLGKRLYEG